MKKILVIAAAVLVLAGLGLGFFTQHTWVSGHLVHNGIEALDLSGAPLEDLQNLARLQKLQTLNLEGTGITAQDYETIQSWLPGCRISWLVPFQGSFLPLDTAQLSVSSLTAGDVETLGYLQGLKTVDATACRDYEAIFLLQQRRPEMTVNYAVEVSGQLLPEDATSLRFSGETLAELTAALDKLPQVSSVTVTGCRDALGLKALGDARPELELVYDVYFGDTAVANTCESLTLDISCLEALEQQLPCFPKLQEVTLEGDAGDAAVHALADAWSQVKFHYSFPLLGKTVHTDDTFLDLSGIPMEDTQALEAALPYFHGLTQVDMLRCGISNQEMEALNNRHPETAFVWLVRLCGRDFRTDIKTFYPTGWGLWADDASVVNLRYCTQVEALDLGHFELSNCDFVEYMPKLKYAVLAIGTIEDVRPLGTLKELKYLELFMSDVTDYWPLINCTSLEDLNVSYSGHGDISPLLQMPWLNRLWLCNHKTTDEEKALLAQHLPDTIMVFDSSSSTDKGWRASPNYYLMRDALGTYYMIF